MKKQQPATSTHRPLLFNAGNNTTSSASATVYRSLELPLAHGAASPFASSSSFGGGGASKAAALSSKPGGEVVWEHATTQAPPPSSPPSPGLFSFSSNCISLPNGTADELVQLVDRALASHHVDVLAYSPYEWQCSLCRPGSFVDTRFVIRLFSTGQLDFQRECGCVYEFNALFCDLEAELGGVAMPQQQQPATPRAAAAVACTAATTTCSPRRREFKVMDLPQEIKQENEAGSLKTSSSSTTSSTNNALVRGMCASQLVDVQREGLTKLARLLDRRGDEGADISPCQRLLSELVQAKDVQVRRLAVTNLALLVKENPSPCSGRASSSSCQFTEEQVRAVANVLLDETDMPETRRQAGWLMRKLLEKDVAKYKPMVCRCVFGGGGEGSGGCARIICHDAQLGQIVADLHAATTTTTSL